MQYFERVYTVEKFIEQKELMFYAKHRTILVVDDEEINLKILVNILETYFKKVLTAKNGQEAFDIFEKNMNISLIITDINMPIMDGRELSEKIKAKYDTPILVLSSNEDKDTFIELINIGIDKFIPKPLNIKMLIVSLKKTLEALKHKEYIKSLTKFDINSIDKTINKPIQQMQKTKQFSISLENLSIQEFLSHLMNNGFTKEELESKFNSISIESKLLEKTLYDIVVFSSDIEYQLSLSKIEELFYEASKRFLSIHYKILDFDTLQPLADVFFEFHSFFDSCKNFDDFTSEQILELINLEFIYLDIKNCIEELFVNNSAENICIFPDMLNADLRQLELKVQTEEDNDYGQLDFF
jgi:CheY-like chemotaxis protein